MHRVFLTSLEITERVIFDCFSFFQDTDSSLAYLGHLSFPCTELSSLLKLQSVIRDKKNLLKGKKRKKGLGCFLLLVLRHCCLKNPYPLQDKRVSVRTKSCERE